jgi:hypothetical protein
VTRQLSLFGPPPVPPAPGAAPAPLRALSLWQPWAHAIVWGSKRLENRKWAPWRSVVGQVIALHATDHVEPLSLAQINENFGTSWRLEDLARKAVVGLARVTGHITADDPRAATDPWWMGPIAWTLEDVVRIDPVPCRGAQGLWLLEGPVLARVRAAEALARGAKREGGSDG